ncbi:MAG: nucleotide pyrophosphohydrolase [Bacteroidetes bacterium]|nr:MAG: nucleotide pyrophosphohydrolase [Bacteroidota bacterium]
MSDIAALTAELVAFRDARDWAQFHNPRNLALALSIEAAELNELFLWKTDPAEADPARLREELADVLAYAFLLAERLDLDVAEIMRAKMALNARKYPVDKARGKATKYDEL